jgi:hypothetical protein
MNNGAGRKGLTFMTALKTFPLQFGIAAIVVML